MSAFTHVTVFCDYPSCGQWEVTADTAREARSRLPHWRTNVPNPDGSSRLDYCPLHKDQVAPKPPAEATP